MELPDAGTGIVIYGVMPVVIMLVLFACLRKKHPMSLFFFALLIVWCWLPFQQYGPTVAWTLFTFYIAIVLVPLVGLRIAFAVLKWLVGS